MTFDDIPAGAVVFIDANPFIYAITADPQYGPACERLLQRIENKEFSGVTSAHVVAEMAHRLMTIEAASLLGRPLTGMANWLKRHPQEVQRLSRFRQAIDELAAVPIQVLPVSGALVSRAADLSIQHGLLTNDALVVAVMLDSGLTHLASLDADFDRVPGLNRYAPV
jgi:predicted nucleic acid-binding protein